MATARSSDATPYMGNPDSTAMKRPVFLRDLITVSTSNGLMERRLMTSASTPYFCFSSAAALRDRPTHRDRVTIVRSFPGRSIFALPIGRTKSFWRTASLTGKDSPYNNLREHRKLVEYTLNTNQ